MAARVLACALLPLLTQLAAAQDTLGLRELLGMTSATHPILRTSRLESQAAAQDVDVAKQQRWPTISAQIESETGTLYDAPSRAITVEQSLWDGGRANLRIDAARAMEAVSITRVQMQRYELWIQLATAWQNLLSSRGRISVAENTIKRLESYGAQMERRVQAEASPRIELELVRARILQTRVELTHAMASQRVALAKLEQLSGADRLSQRTVGAALPDTVSLASMAQALEAADLYPVAVDQPSVTLARQEADIARVRLKYKDAEKWPELYFRLRQPVGSSSRSADTKTSAFLGVRFSSGAGFSQLTEAQALATRAEGAEQVVESAIRDALNVLQNEREEFLSASGRLAALEDAVEGAALVLESYSRQFQGGRKTWLDVLNAARELAQNQYATVDAQSSMAGALYRLQIRMGKDPA